VDLIRESTLITHCHQQIEARDRQIFDDGFGEGDLGTLRMKCLVHPLECWKRHGGNETPGLALARKADRPSEALMPIPSEEESHEQCQGDGAEDHAGRVAEGVAEVLNDSLQQDRRAARQGHEARLRVPNMTVGP
jgi:hypothetical protein